ncbi:hypothetical protein OH687_01430 [Burkholderia anthina]|nr:hypothetical protein OH687_01430 [Burkholderia anthina]
MQCSTPIGTDARRLRARGGVANPRDASGIRCGLLLATNAHPLAHQHRLTSNTAPPLPRGRG